MRLKQEVMESGDCHDACFVSDCAPILRHWMNASLSSMTAVGEIIRYGGKSIKMSSDYDLARLLTGSEGTIGIITKVTVKLLTLPAYRRTMVAIFAELDVAAEAVAAIIANGAVPSSLELLTKNSIETIEAFIPLWLPKDAEAFLLIELDGHEGRVNEETQQIIAICQDNGVRETKIARDAAEAERMWLARRVLFPATARPPPTC